MSDIFKDRHAKLGCMVLTLFSKVVQTILKYYVTPQWLKRKYLKKDIHFIFTENEIVLMDKLPNMDDLTIEICYKILRSEDMLDEPKCKWGNVPHDTELEIADDMQRLINATNSIISINSEEVTKKYSEKLHEEIKLMVTRIDSFLEQDAFGSMYNSLCKSERDSISILQDLTRVKAIDVRFEKMPIKFYWGESFDRCLKNLRSMLKDEKAKGREKVRVQIIFQNEEDVETTINILNSLKVEINEGLAGIEFIVATSGSVILNVDIMLKMLETDERLQTTMALFIEKILELFTTTPTESIAIVLLPVEEFTQWNKSKNIGEPVYLDFDIEAQLFETDDKIEEQLGQISDAVIKHSSGSGTNRNITATLLPISLENISTTEKAFAQAQTTVRYNLPVSVTLRQQLNVKKSINVNQNIWDCIKIGDTLAFTESLNNQLIICNSDSTNIHHIPLHYKPWYLTEVDSTTVAISCMIDRTILMINISTGNVIDKIETSDYCYGISYNDNTLYVVIGKSIIHVMDLRGNVFRTIYLPADSTVNITADRDRLVCIDKRSIFCWSLDGKLIWTFENGKYESLRGVTTDNKGNVYVTDYYTNAVVEVSDEGKHHREILTKSDSLNHPCGIYFQKKENVLLVCNINDIKAFLFDVNRNINEQD